MGDEIEQLKHKIELLETELAALKTAFGETYARSTNADIVPEWRSWPSWI
jgi:hypothetical protein